MFHARIVSTCWQPALGLSALLCLLLLPFDAAAQQSPNPAAQGSQQPAAEAPQSTEEVPQEHDPENYRQRVIHERVSVVGSQEAAREIPGSAHFLNQEQLEEQSYSDVHRILTAVPGVYFQEEDGLGLRPNIGIRGTGVERSSKITLMEDGVLIAPAPYTAPSAYYFPTAGRMEGIEVRKGSSAIQFGPRTNGGVLNLISRSAPTQLGGRVELAGGDHDTRRGHVYAGDSGERFSWVAESYQLHSDGFKDLDGGGDTGVELEDYLLKLRVSSSPTAAHYQALELKLGKTLQDGNETYLGITESDFLDTPYRRYAASALDNIEADHEQIQLSHFLQVSSKVDLTTVAYHNDFFRDWFKNESVLGVSNATVLANPELYSRELAILRGEEDSPEDALRLRHNNRNYYSQGIQSVLGVTHNTGRARHAIELGVRYHEDEEDRLQAEDLYQMIDGRLVLHQVGAPGSQSNRVSDAQALAFFAQDRISFGDWTFTPGVRFETIEFTRRDFSTSDPTRSAGPTRVRENGVDVWIPGLGVDYQINASDRVFAGVHRGFAPPGAGAAPETDPEKSTNYELGWRRNRGPLSFEAIGFFNDYENLLGTETVAGGGGTAADQFNGGAVDVQGLEISAAYELGGARQWPVSVPLRLAYTYTQSEFKTSFESDFADWEPQVEAGDELPYLPENQLTASIGVVASRWGVHLNANYQDALRTSPGQGAIPAGEGTDSRVLFDLSADTTFFSRYRVFASLRNLTDETYVASRRPYGLRPGLPRTLLVGFSAKF